MLFRSSLLPVAILVAQGVQAWTYYDEQVKAQQEPVADTDVVAYFRDHAGSALVPYYHVPQLHYYSPKLKTIGYDTDWSVDRVAKAIAQHGPSDLVCAEQQCRAFEASLPNGWIQGQERITRDVKPEMWVLRTVPTRD